MPALTWSRACRVGYSCCINSLLAAGLWVECHCRGSALPTTARFNWLIESSCGLQVDDDEDVYADVSAPEQNGSRRRFWQFNDSRPEPEPLIQPSRKQKSPKRRGPSAAHQPREVNMSGNSLSSRFAEPISWPSTTSETAYATEEGTEDSYTTPDGWTVINDSLIDSASQELEEEGSLGRRSMEHASLGNGTERSLEGAQEVGSSRGAQHSKRGTSSLASNGIPSTASQRGAERSIPSYLTLAVPPQP